MLSRERRDHAQGDQHRLIIGAPDMLNASVGLAEQSSPADRFSGTNACVAPVLSLEEAPEDHTTGRGQRSSKSTVSP